MYTHMKRNLNVRALVFLLVATLALVPMTGRAEQATTTANVTFVDGILEIGDITGGSGMNLRFGEHAIPAAAVSYPSTNDDAHILPVEDSRMTSGGWHVTVALTTFASASDGSFSGLIHLTDPSVANRNTSAGTSGLSVEDTITVAGAGGAVLVMAADDTLPRGIFTATWAQEDVSLEITNAEVTKLAATSYDATLTWTLNIGPY